jgi:hypothetical protein
MYVASQDVEKQITDNDMLLSFVRLQVACLCITQIAAK